MTLKQFLELPENKTLKEEIGKRWTGLTSNNSSISVSMLTVDGDLKLKWKCLDENNKISKHYFVANIKDILKHGLYCRTCDFLKPVEIKDTNGNKKILCKAKAFGLKNIKDLENGVYNKKKKLKKNNLYDWCKNNGEHGKQILREFTGIAIDGNIHRIEELTFGLSDRKFYWVCQNNPNHVFAAKISLRTYRGDGCPKCAKIRSGTGYEEQFLYHAFKLIIPKTEHSEILFTNEYKGGLEYDLVIPYKDKYILIEYGNTFTHNKNNPDRVKKDNIKKKKALLNDCKFISILDDAQNEYPEKWEADDIVLKINNTPDKTDRLLKITKFILENFNISTEPLDDPDTIQKIKDIAWQNSKGSGLTKEKSLEEKHPILAKEILPELNGGLTARDLMPTSNKYINFKCNHCGRIWDTYVHSRVNKKSGCTECGYNPFKEEKGLPQKIKSKYKQE